MACEGPESRKGETEAEEAYILSAFRRESQADDMPRQDSARSSSLPAPWEEAVAQASSAAMAVVEGRFLATPPTRSRQASEDQDGVNLDDENDALPSTDSLKATLQLLRWRARDRGGLSAPPGPPGTSPKARDDAAEVVEAAEVPHDTLAAAVALEAAAVGLADAAAQAAACLT